MKNRDRQRDKFQGAATVMQLEPLPVKVERQILESNPSLIRSGATSYSFHSIGTITDSLFAVQGTTKGSKREKSKKKNCRQRRHPRNIFRLQFKCYQVLNLWFACLREHKLGKIKSSTLSVVVQNTKLMEE
ncbi:hypothetical protein SO802_022671 [Lithocarpus litseifolius]|uniref:Uncharacterized protein n=1 Tax=Lithocarpus litseifolius TaxID=425828 RepID=A0AAW2C5J1_9ROSI